MGILVLFIIAVLVFGILAYVVGSDSTERFDSLEWERRAQWWSLGGHHVDTEWSGRE